MHLNGTKSSPKIMLLLKQLGGRLPNFCLYYHRETIQPIEALRQCCH